MVPDELRMGDMIWRNNRVKNLFYEWMRYYHPLHGEFLSDDDINVLTARTVRNNYLPEEGSANFSEVIGSLHGTPGIGAGTIRSIYYVFYEGQDYFDFDDVEWSASEIDTLTDMITPDEDEELGDTGAVRLGTTAPTHVTRVNRPRDAAVNPFEEAAADLAQDIINELFTDEEVAVARRRNNLPGLARNARDVATDREYDEREAAIEEMEELYDGAPQPKKTRKKPGGKTKTRRKKHFHKPRQIRIRKR